MLHHDFQLVFSIVNVSFGFYQLSTSLLTQSLSGWLPLARANLYIVYISLLTPQILSQQIKVLWWRTLKVLEYFSSLLRHPSLYKNKTLIILSFPQDWLHISLECLSLCKL